MMHIFGEKFTMRVLVPWKMRTWPREAQSRARGMDLTELPPSFTYSQKGK